VPLRAPRPHLSEAHHLRPPGRPPRRPRRGAHGAQSARDAVRGNPPRCWPPAPTGSCPSRSRPTRRPRPSTALAAGRPAWKGRRPRV